MPSFFITTAIDYTNGAPHIGHAYEKVLADVLARYHRLKGDDRGGGKGAGGGTDSGEHVFFLTGVDQHGQKVQQSAEKAGVAPQQFVDEITAKFTALWEKLEVHYDAWAATTDPKHKDCVRAILQRLWDDRGGGKGAGGGTDSGERDPATGASRWIYKKTQRGFYSVRQEQFLTDKERGPDGEFGAEWGQVEEREEENYYFRLAGHRDWLRSFIQRRSEQGRPFVVPDFRVAELLNAVEKIEGDLCITRPKARLSWGIEVPFDPEFVTFVWFDALVNYLSFAPGGAERMKKSVEECGDAPSSAAAEGPSSSSFIPPPSSFSAFWPALHVIGKDILIPAHGIYWPVMLKALGFTDDEMPTLLVHGWWNIRGKGGKSEKMSKSLGNVVDPDVLADKYGAEAVRYYLMSDIATGRDADFSEERLIQRYNTDLANSLGNLLNRTLSMAAKYRGGILRRNEIAFGILDVLAAEPQFNPADTELTEETTYADYFGFVSDGYTDSIEGLSFQHPGIRLGPAGYDIAGALHAVGEMAKTGNKLVEREAPWKLAKDPAQAERLDAVLYTLAESLRIIAILLCPVLPRAAHGIFDQLNWKMAESGRSQRFHLDDAQWGGLPDGHVLGQPTPLFPRIEPPAT